MKLKSKKESLILAVCGFFAGLVNTLIGAGGGVILVFAMSFFVSGVAEKSVYAVTNATIMLLSFLSVISYIRQGAVDFGEIVFFVAPALIGGFVGALLLGKIKTRYLRLIFAAITLYSGVKLLL